MKRPNAPFLASFAADAARAPLRSYALMLAAWMFDFRASGEGQGLAIQAIFAGVYLFAFALFVIGDHGRAMRIEGLGIFMFCSALFLATGLGAGLADGQSIYPLFRNGFSIVVYVTAVYATARIVVSASPTVLRQMLGLACLVYAIASFFITQLQQGAIDLSRARFEIVGNSVIAALAYLTLLLTFRLTRIELGTMLVNFALVFLSVTRTFLIVVMVQALPAIRNARSLFGPRIIAYSLLAVAVIVMVLVSGQFGVERWSERLQNRGSASGQDITYLTRLSEWQFMWNAFLSSVDSFLFGHGFAARTVYWIPKEVGGGFEESIGFGHNQYLSMLFTAGFIGAMPLVAVQLQQAWRAYRFLVAAIRAGRSQSDLLFVGAWGALIVLGMLSANYLMSIFGSRGGSLWFGIGTGMLLGVQAWFDPINRRLPRRPAPRVRRGIPQRA
jgi:O-antigen ligase